jgi:hypothetical protein
VFVELNVVFFLMNGTGEGESFMSKKQENTRDSHQAMIPAEENTQQS